LMPVFLFIASGGSFLFAYAKPVPYNPYNLRDQKWDPALVGIAGPLSNILVALIFGLAIRFLPVAGLEPLFAIIVYANVLLAVFNLIPIPPLDGSQIFNGLMSRRNPELVMKLQMYGPQILLGLILFGMISGFSILWLFMKPFVTLFMYLFMNLGAFFVLIYVKSQGGGESFDDFRGLGWKMPIVGIVMTVFMLSLTGIPPTAGFVAKVYIFNTAGQLIQVLRKTNETRSEISWNGRPYSTIRAPVGPGIYFYVVQSRSDASLDKVQTGTFVVVR